MKLLVGSILDYCVLKIRMAATLSGLELDICTVPLDELTSMEPSSGTAKSIILQVPGRENISNHLEILKLLKPDQSAEVESFLASSWKDLEVPLQLLLALSSSSSAASSTTSSGNNGDNCSSISSPPSESHVHPALKLDSKDRDLVEKKARCDVSVQLEALERKLLSNTYVVGERLSLADISLFAICGALTKVGGSISELQSFASLYRWFLTVGNHPKLSAFAPKTTGGGLDAPSSVKFFTNAVSPAVTTTASLDSPSFKWKRSRIRVKELLHQGDLALGTEVTVKGWIRTSRIAEKGQILFVELTDGSTVKGIQLVLNATTTAGMDMIANSGGVGASLSAAGMVVASPAKGQTIEIHVHTAQLIGAVYGGDNGEIGGKNYPMAKKAHSLEYLRDIAHLRPRSKMFSSAMRMRNAMAFATHKFFHDRGFIYTHTPLITAADCEGAGEQFVVTTLLPEHAKLSDVPTDNKGNVDFSKDFFGRRCCMTVSGQLNVETHACALSDVYTFGPTFRAENSHTSRHLAEFWMIEPEICFATLSDDMALAEDYVRYCAKYALDNCSEDLAYFEDEYPMGEKGLRERLRNVAESDFARITYTDAVELLQKEIASGAALFERYPNWGDDLGSEHERYITEKIYKKPTIVINYPKGIKAFYMKLNDDNITVAAMDILVPRIGELIGGSQREDNLRVLEERCLESGLKIEDMWWYVDMRRYGSVPHAGFGLGFERLIMFVTGLENIRDVIPFPRVPGRAEF